MFSDHDRINLGKKYNKYEQNNPKCLEIKYFINESKMKLHRNYKMFLTEQ